MLAGVEFKEMYDRAKHEYLNPTETLDDYKLLTVKDGPVISLPTGKYYELIDTYDEKSRDYYRVAINHKKKFTVNDLERADMKLLIYQGYDDLEGTRYLSVAKYFSYLEERIKKEMPNKKLVTYYVETNARPKLSAYGDMYLPEENSNWKYGFDADKVHPYSKIRVIKPYGSAKSLLDFYTSYLKKLNQYALPPLNQYVQGRASVIVLLDSNNKITTVFTHKVVPTYIKGTGYRSSPYKGVNLTALITSIGDHFGLPRREEFDLFGLPISLERFSGGIEAGYIQGAEFNSGVMNEEIMNWSLGLLSKDGIRADVAKAKAELKETITKANKEILE